MEKKKKKKKEKVTPMPLCMINPNTMKPRISLPMPSITLFILPSLPFFLIFLTMTSISDLLLKPFNDLDLPPRKLLPKLDDLSDMSSLESSLRKYLPSNDSHKSAGFDDDLDPYSSDHFRMYEFKVRRCTRSRSHDWTDCPFAHPGEKARRRDPRRFHYSGTVCPEFRRGGCSRGDNCEFAHGVFECWLHPSRYRTEACKDGKNCKRKICFFAHSARELRILPEIVTCGSRKYEKGYLNGHSHCCCLVGHSVASSPTSTLMGLSHISPPISPSSSPPLSPVKNRSLTGFSPVSRYSDRVSKLGSGGINYRDVFTELMASLEAMGVSEAGGSCSSPSTRNSVVGNPWIDVSFAGEDQPQFILSPSTPNPPVGCGNFFSNGSSKSFIDNYKINAVQGGAAAGNGGSDPDLGWVNDLLM